MPSTLRTGTVFGQWWPKELETLPDGLYGDVDSFMVHFEAGLCELEHDMLTADNALDDMKIKIWIGGLNVTV